MRGLSLLGLSLWLGVAGMGCSPRLVPLYYDYQLPSATEAPLYPVAQALTAAGWEVIRGDSLHLETAPRAMRHWGLYQVVVRLEAVSVDGRFVRLFIHPYRRYLTGRRSKIPYLPAGLQAILLPQLHTALAAKELKPIGTAFQRDRLDSRR